MMRHDVALDRILRRALARAGVVIGYEHRCRRHGCGFRERRNESHAGACPRCAYQLYAKGIPRHVRFHDLRHTTATFLLKEGVPLAVVQKLLRHSDPKLTAEIYGHLDVADVWRGLGCCFGAIALSDRGASTRHGGLGTLCWFATPRASPRIPPEPGSTPTEVETKSSSTSNPSIPEVNGPRRRSSLLPSGVRRKTDPRNGGGETARMAGAEHNRPGAWPTGGKLLRKRASPSRSSWQTLDRSLASIDFGLIALRRGDSRET